jgi:hypothetical protein
MGKKMKKYKLTLIGLVLSSIVFIITYSLNLDLFEIMIEKLKALEKFEIDEIIIPIFIFSIFAFFDQTRRQKSQEVEYEKIKIYKAMLLSTHHILNNFLNQVQLFKMTAERTPGFDPEVLSLYNTVIENASTQIEALGNITNIDEKSIYSSVAPE